MAKRQATTSLTQRATSPPPAPPQPNATATPRSLFKIGMKVHTNLVYTPVGATTPTPIEGPITAYQDPQGGRLLPWKVGGFWHAESDMTPMK